MKLKDKDSLDKVIYSGINYLFCHQFPNGEFASYISGDAEMKGWIRPDSTLFTTALISHSLHYINLELSEKIQSKSLDFLGGEMCKGGLWNHFSKYHPYRNICPPDIDDTCCIAALYRDKGIQFPNPLNKQLIRLNRNKKGLYYTWFIFRIKQLKSRVYRRYFIPDLLSSFKRIFFWNKVEASRNDIDAVVNAYVLYYLGETTDTLPIIDFIISIINSGKEGDCDLWYRDPFIVYYFITRNYFKGVSKLELIKEALVSRILSQSKPDGRIGKTVLDTAWAICSLINLNHSSIELETAITFLCELQEKEGNWPRWIAYYGGPKKLTGYGSEELTTAFCLEAISRYKEKIRL